MSGLQFVYSKLMCWVAVDRAIRLADRRSFPVRNRDKWVKTRDEIYLEIMEKGWNPQKNAFTIHYGSFPFSLSLNDLRTLCEYFVWRGTCREI